MALLFPNEARLGCLAFGLWAMVTWLCAAPWVCSAAEPNFLRRLDGTKIRAVEAEEMAWQILADARVTGAQIAIVDRGQLVWSRAFGLRRKEGNLPMDRETTLWAASITKSVFATFVMQLVEKGEFDLDQPIANQLPQSLEQYEPYKVTATELVKDPRWRLVTPRILLSHSSGLKNFSFLEPDKKMHLHFQPGTAFSYSGEGINLVQFLIEQKKGRPLDQLLQEAIFQPLGMRQTGIIYREEFAANVADRYDRAEQFLSQTKRFPARAAGSMTTSAEDLARFAVALLDGRLLRPKTRKAMLQPALFLHTLHQFPLAANEPAGLEGPAVGLAYGVGWGLLTKTRFGPAFFKEGHGDGAQNYMICFAKRQACMILLTNSDNGELAFRPLLEKLWGNTVTPWEWEGYSAEYLRTTRANPPP